MRSAPCALVLGVLAFAFGHMTYAQQPVLQRGYDAGLSGANLTETVLTSSNVTPSTFGLAFTLPVDDKIYAQPLYVPQVAIAGQGTHNVVYVATMSDTLYAFDADVGGTPLWSVNFATSVGALPVPIVDFTFAGNTNITGNVGILSTPVIDPSTHIMYLVACTLEGSTMVYRLHAVDITNGTEPYTNVVISGSYGGVTFNAAHQTQRPSLTLAGNQVVFGFGAIEAESDDLGGYSGWVMAYNKQTLVQSGSFATVTTGTQGGGVWQSGRPPLVDSAGFVYVFTGNGYTNGYNGTNDFSESVLKLNPAAGLALVDWFTPSNWSTLDADDLDLASSGPLLIPGTSPSLLAGGGKTGVLYVLNTTDLGHYSASDSGVVQEEAISASSLRGGPVYWQRSTANGGPLLYDWGSDDWVKAYAFNGTTFGATPSYQGSGTQIYPGGILTLSANGQLQGSGVLWATVAASGNVYNDAVDPGVLYAFDADNVATELWSSTMNSARDNFGYFAKFVPPLVANGKVYVATFSDQVAVYGLLTATPTFSLAPGTYSSTQQVALSDTTPGAVVYYTTNGTTPSVSSAQYIPGTPLSISATETVEAMAAASGYANSAVAVEAYTISSSGTTSVNLSTAADVVGIDNVGTAVSGGGLDGHGDAYAANLLGTSITWAGSTFALGSAGVVDAVSNLTITLPAGSYASLNLVATGVNGNQANQTFVVTYTDGTTTNITQSLSDWYTPQSYAGESIVSTMGYRVTLTGAADDRTFYLYGYSFALNSAKTVKSITLPPNSNVVVLAIDLVPGSSLPVAATPTFSPVPGTYTGAQQVTLSDTTAGAVIYYTTNGTTPNTSSAHGVSGTPLSISATETVKAIAVESGYTDSSVASGTYTIVAEPVAATPTFSPAPGTYSGAQQVTLSDTTAGAVIYYTTNGTTPTVSSVQYAPGTPLSISATETVKAMAVASGYTNSAVAVGTYTISASSGTTSVNLSTVADIVGIDNVGTAVSGGGLDGHGDAYAENLLGTSITWAGSTFALGSAGVDDVVSNLTITLPAGSYANLNLIATGVNGDQVNQTFVVTYTDGTTTSITQSLSDWYTPQSYAGESIVSTMAYRVTLSGTADDRTFYLYGYSFALNSAKTVKSVTLPQNANVVVLAIDLVPASSLPVAATPTFSPAPGTYTGVRQVTLSDTTAGAVIYYTTNGTTPTVSSSQYIPGTPLSISATETVKAIAVESGYTDSSVANGTYTIVAEPVAATPTFSPAPGTYSGAQQVTLSDTTPGAVIYYTTNDTTPTTSSTAYAGGSLTISATETIEAMAVASGYTNSAVAVGTYTISDATSVNLSTVADIVGIDSVGTAVSGGGIDGHGDAYAANLLGTSITWAGSTFALGNAGVDDVVSNLTITLPAGSYENLNLLATGVNGDQVNQTFMVTYTDGTTTSITQSLSDWYTPQDYAGESIVSTMAYRVTLSGAADDRTFYLYGYSFALDSAKTVKSITLPQNRDVVLLSLDLVP